MKTTIAFISAAIVLFVNIFQVSAGILFGPITNASNGHDYYLLTPNTWSASEKEAENLGGTLATIRNVEEQKWLYSNFGDYDGTNRDLWIGLHRNWPQGPFAWVTGEKMDYNNWAPGEPNNAGGMEMCVEMWPDDKSNCVWNDAPDSNSRYGIVEVQGNSKEASLTKKEKSLIGVWYDGGDGARPCYITGTENMLFAINNGRAGRILSTQDNGLFLTSWNVHGEIIKDTILWNNSSWWSRTPSNYSHKETPLSSEALLK